MARYLKLAISITTIQLVYTWLLSMNFLDVAAPTQGISLSGIASATGCALGPLSVPTSCSVLLVGGSILSTVLIGGAYILGMTIFVAVFAVNEFTNLYILLVDLVQLPLGAALIIITLVTLLYASAVIFLSSGRAIETF